MALKIDVLATGIIYRNPKPYLRAVHAMHPSLMAASDTEIIATFDLGQGAESLDYHTVLARSRDGGSNWTLEGPIIKVTPARLSTHSIRPSLLANGTLLGIQALYVRNDPEEGILNRQNLGLVPTELYLMASEDLGKNWSQPQPLKPPLESPAWEVSHAPLQLSNGTLALPLSTWRGWDGRLPPGQQAVVLLSEDRGKTWPRFSRSFDGRSSGFIHWEQCVIEWGSGMLAVAWEYDPKETQTRPTVFSMTEGRPAEFGPAQATGFLAETCKILALGSDRLLAVYRRMDRPGLWATIARIQGKTWVNESSAPLWQGAVSRMLGEGKGADELSGLKFGSPSMKRLSDGTVIVAFWCHEDEISNIRWIKLSLT